MGDDTGRLNLWLTITPKLRWALNHSTVHIDGEYPVEELSNVVAASKSDTNDQPLSRRKYLRQILSRGGID